jgi:short-chain 2-methylacyl-CoA dehydrogenase
MTWFDDEHEAFRSVVRDFARRELAPKVDAWEAAGELPLDAVAAMAELGLFGIVFPEEWGGSGGDFTSLCIAIEEIGAVSQSLGITLSAAVGLGANPIHSFGTDEQKAQWLPDLVHGRRLGAFGLTEPDAGSDAGGTRTRAVLDESTGEWVLDGSKAFITNSGTPITSIVTVTALTGTGEISSFVVPAGTPGMTIEPAYRKLGWHASDTHGIVLHECRVPAANMLGARGSGLRNFLAILDDGRIAISALAVGCAQACLDLAVDYAKERQAFGGPIGRFQGLATASALMAMRPSSRWRTAGTSPTRPRP